MRRIIALLAGMLCVSAVAQEQPADDEAAAAEVEAVVSDAPEMPIEQGGAVYRSVGEDGSIVFSDSPSPGAEKVEIRETQTIEAPPPPNFVYERPQPAAAAYARVAIVDPADDAQIRENTGNLTVAVAVEPGLSGMDQVVLLMDGLEAAAGRQTSFSLQNVDRGTHALSAVVRSPDGKTLSTSPTVTFHMLRYHETPPKPAPAPKPKK
jgi:hypothetical protein